VPALLTFGAQLQPIDDVVLAVTQCDDDRGSVDAAAEMC
jgi:hypothetical protein